jgi:hypothetical protein
MGRRRRSLRRAWLAMLMLAGLFVAVPASTSERDLVSWSLGSGCARSFADGSEDTMGAIGTPSLGGLNCPGAPDGCGGLDYQ